MKLCTILFLAFCFFAQGQDNYDFSVSNRTYLDLVGSTSLNNGQVWDDDQFTIPLGFDFKIGASTFNTIYIVDWGSGGVLSQKKIPVGQGAIILPIGQDLIDLGYDVNSSLSNISYKIEGTPGDRIVKIEWNNAGFWDDVSSSDYCNFQLWLYENSQALEYHYGPSAINNPADSFEGETGPIVGFVPTIDFGNSMPLEFAYFLTGNPTNPNLVKVDPNGGGQDPNSALQGMIPSGTVYKFAPKSLATEDFTEEVFVLYPNPTTDYIFVRSEVANYQLSIFNYLGQKVSHATGPEGAIDVSHLSDGSYFVKIETAQGSTFKKFLKK